MNRAARILEFLATDGYFLTVPRNRIRLTRTLLS
jgi:hypothetical protein